MDMEWMTIKEIAKYLRVSVSTIRKFVKIEKLPNYRQRYIIRLKQSDIETFLTLNTYKTRKAHDRVKADKQLKYHLDFAQNRNNIKI